MQTHTSSGAVMEHLDTRHQELARLIDGLTGSDGHHTTPIEALSLSRASAPTQPSHMLHGSALCIVAQGRKQVQLAQEVYRYDPAHMLVISVALPMMGCIAAASPEAPYLGLNLALDPALIGEVMIEAHLPTARESELDRGLFVSRVEPPMLDAAIRLLRLLDSPQDMRVLAPLALREIYYRLLTSSAGPRLRQIAVTNSQTQRIATAITWLKDNYDQPLHIQAMSREMNLSPSGLHHLFKAVTAMSPLQYQKQLRLQAARRLMLGEGLDATTAGLRVGYTSPSQFSREYSRLFGAPPLRDIARLRTATGAET